MAMNDNNRMINKEYNYIHFCITDFFDIEQHLPILLSSFAL